MASKQPSLVNQLMEEVLQMERDTKEANDAFSRGKNDISSFVNLPHEVHLAIIDSLYDATVLDDVPAVIALSQTNRYFHSFCDHKKLCSRSKIIRFLLLAEDFDKYEFGPDGRCRDFDGYACFTCCKVLPDHKFAEHQTVGARGRSRKHQLWRVCTACARSLGKVAEAGSRVVEGRVQKWTYASCRKAKERGFCKMCLVCKDCHVTCRPCCSEVCHRPRVREMQ